MESYKTLWLVAFLLLAGCGGSSGGSSTGGGSTPAPTYPAVQGKWTVRATSTQGQVNYIVLANFINQGGGSFYATNSSLMCVNTICEGSLLNNGTLTIQGTVTTAGVLTISLVVPEQGGGSCTTTVTGQLSGNTMSGQYTSCNDSGTLNGTANSPSTGAYAGQLTSTENGMSFAFSASITEASDFTVTGSAAIMNSPCFTSLTFGPPSQAVGEGVLLEDAQHGVIVVALPSELGTNVAYGVIPTSFCGSDQGTGTLTRQ